METLEKLDKTSEIAEKELAKIEAKEQATKDAATLKAKEEAEIAFSEKSPTEQKKITDQKAADDKLAADNKTKEITKAQEEAEAENKLKNAKPDEELLKAEDKDLNEEELTRKKELIQKTEDAKSPEQKLKDWQEKTNKRFDTLTSELKAALASGESDSKTIEILESNLASLRDQLKESGSIESEETKDAKGDSDRYAKMVTEDQDLPREERREMSKEDIEEFLLEDIDGATDWKVKRELRRRDERDVRLNSKKDADSNDKKAEQFFTDFPECNQETRHKELVKEGKTNAQAIEVIMGESEDFKLMMEIMNENPKFSPSLLSEEMQKRKAVKPEIKESYTKEEVDQMIEDKMKAEKERIASIDTGLTNSMGEEIIKEGSPLYKERWRIWQIASKRPGAKGDWSKKEFERVLQYGKDNRMAEGEDALSDV